MHFFTKQMMSKGNAAHTIPTSRGKRRTAKVG
jgi:hypothetical protein